jgi:hypothetical protein
LSALTITQILAAASEKNRLELAARSAEKPA